MTAKRGSPGGQAVVRKYGRTHMRDLALKWHEKYKLVPYGTEDFLIVERATGKVNRKTLNGRIYNPNHK